MPNMSYCRFQNTAADLADCVDAMDEAHDLKSMNLSKDEFAAMQRMRDLCERFIDAHVTLQCIEEEEES